MVVGLLLCAIGLIPITLAINIHRTYKESKLTNFLVMYMFLITCWQFYLGILYFVNVWEESNILFFFRLLRMGPILSIPVVYYVAYLIIKDQPTTLNENQYLNKVIQFLFHKRMLIIVITWSLFTYFINWTSFAVKDLEIININNSLTYYFPVYGPLGWLHVVHMSSFVLFLILIFFVSKKIINHDVKNFLTRFSSYSIFLFAFGVFNFSPTSGVLMSSIGVIIFSIGIMVEFMKLNNNIKLNYYKILERQKKMDYTGNLTGSLIHEVKNTNQIIKGFSNMLIKSDRISENDRSLIELIIKSSHHLNELANNYNSYMNSSNVSYQIEDLDKIINESILLSSKLLKESHTEIEFINNYHPLKAYSNKVNLGQVFINLIKNSVEAMPEERTTRKIRIETKLTDTKIIIHFIDTGKGIPPENWESVFDPFISFKDRGMGLGLPFVKKVIIEHLGNIQIAKSSEQGTHFQIEIPQNGVFNINN